MPGGGMQTKVIGFLSGVGRRLGAQALSLAAVFIQIFAVFALVIAAPVSYTHLALPTCDLV